MKDLQEIHTRLRNELKQWFTKQVHNEFEDYYLYYLPSTREHDSGLLISNGTHKNLDYQLAMTEKLHKGSTIQQNYNHIVNSGILNRLPILDIA